MQAGYGAPKSGTVPGADALLTRGRPYRRRRCGEAWTDSAGSETPGMHGNTMCGTREALHLTWGHQVRTANPHGTRP